MSDQLVFTPPEFADNPEPRCPCLLLLDVSGSMGGAPIKALNDGVQAFRDELYSDSLAMKRVEVGMVTFGPVNTAQPFIAAGAFHPPHLVAQGDTPMGAAILQALTMVRLRKDEYRAAGIAYYRPWVFLITDGAPTDAWQQAAAAIKEGEASGAFAFFAVGVQGANMETMRQISVREPLTLDGLKFRELFMWLSASLKSVSQSTPGTTLALAPPSGWASV